MDRLHNIFQNKTFIFIIFTKAYGNTFHRFRQELQPKLSTTAVLGTEKSGRWRELAIAERFIQESMECPPKKVADVERWTLVEVPLF